MPKMKSKGLVSRPDKMDETVLHKCFMFRMYGILYISPHGIVTHLTSDDLFDISQ